MDARQRSGTAGVDAADASMSVRAGEQGRVEHARQMDIIREYRPALGQPQRIHFLLGAPTIPFGWLVPISVLTPTFSAVLHPRAFAFGPSIKSMDSKK